MELFALIAIGWVIGLWVLMFVAAGEIAKVRGRSFGNWAILGLVYGLIAVIAVYLMPPLGPTSKREPHRPPAHPEP